MVKYLKGDLFTHSFTNKDYIFHVCNNKRVAGAGFIVPLYKNFPEARKNYMSLSQDLGCVGLQTGTPNIFNAISQTLGGTRPLNYSALVTCMEYAGKIVAVNKGAIVTCAFGSKLAGGNWDFVEELIKDIWLSKDIPVTIYYLNNKDLTENLRKRLNENTTRKK